MNLKEHSRPVRTSRSPAQLFGSAVAAGYRRLGGPNEQHPIPDRVLGSEPAGTATGVRLTTIDDDASRLPGAPGSYEWWNFFAMDARPGCDLAVSAIFMPANLFDTRYRKRVHAHREGLDDQPPAPGDHPLLQLNLMHDGRKVFTTVRHPPGATCEFSRVHANGRIGESTFSAGVEDGDTVFRVHLDHPNMTNLTRLRGELAFRSPDGGLAFDGGGLYGPLAGGVAHQWQFPLALPNTSGHLRVLDRFGRVKFESDLVGNGYTDHCWGAGLLGDVLDRWYFGRVDLGDAGALVAIWLAPRSRSVPAYGRVLRLRPGRDPVLHEVLELRAVDRCRGSLGMSYFADVTFVLEQGSVRMRFPRKLGEDWPFQVSGEGSFDIELAGDVSLQGAPGPVEHLSQPLIDDRFFGLLDSMVPRIPWVP